MIQLTRLNNHPLTVNCDLIKLVEEAPDTVITLVNGEKILVRERADQVVSRVLQFRRSVLEGLFPATGHISPAIPPGRAGDEACEQCKG
jgi:flagellar protein FlbD